MCRVLTGRVPGLPEGAISSKTFLFLGASHLAQSGNPAFIRTDYNHMHGVYCC